MDHVFDIIDRKIGTKLKNGALAKQTWFYSIFASIYDECYGLNSDLDESAPRKIKMRLNNFYNWADQLFQGERDDLPENIKSAIKGQTTNKSSREKFM